MSRENVEIVRAWIDGYNRRDMERLVELTDPEFEFRSIFVGIESIFRGYEGLQTYFRQLDDSYSSFQVVTSDVIDAGATVLMVADAEWCGRASGAAGATPILTAFWHRRGESQKWRRSPTGAKPSKPWGCASNGSPG